MSDYPIIFSAPMVRALLDGRKAQTRRIPTVMWKKVVPGDRLWVRESIARSGALTGYVAGGPTCHRVWPVEWRHDTRPSIHMPRWASRLTLVVTAVKRERLQDISEEDAIAEGCRSFGPLPGGSHDVPTGGASDAFRALWETLHGRESWDANPEVVALTFTVRKTNIDQMAQAA